jgi:hypothetical protein
LTPPRVEIVRVVGSVELNVLHTLRDKPLNVVPNDLGEILQQIGVSRIEPLVMPAL